MSSFSAFWFVMGIITSILFWAAFALVMLCFRQKRYLYLTNDLLVMILCYLLMQSIAVGTEGGGYQHVTFLSTLSEILFRQPKWMITLSVVTLAAAEALLFRNHRDFEKSRITPMSVKEATDSLPSGLCFYLSSGHVLMKNLAMDRFCQEVTGDSLISGKRLRQQLFTGDLSDGCTSDMVGETLVIHLPDGRSMSIQEREASFEDAWVHMLLVTDVTEQMNKTRSLRRLQKDLTALNEKLTAYNQEIVSLTAQRELLAARVRLHDEMGIDLLTIRQYIENGGTVQDRAAIETRLRRNLNFLTTGQASSVRDEYELMIETAEKLGVRVIVTGDLPPADPQKHVVSTAIHECFTNTLRHAKGDELSITVDQKDGKYVVTFTNNGEQPTDPVQEKGGLSSLRKLAETIGGEMSIQVEPSFFVELTLPKEVPDGL